MSLPEPYYEHAGITIYHGDCRHLLPLLSADLICTEPPYGIGEAAGKNVSRGAGKGRFATAVAKDYGAEAWDNEPPSRWVFELMLVAAKHQIIFGGNYFALPASSCWLVWDKDNGETDFADCELAWTNLKKAVRIKRYRWNGCLQQPGRTKEQRAHPTQKPTEVMSWAITQAPDDCELILDPFMGSGTTLVAAKRLGRKAIGIEQSEKYCELAVQRLAQEVLPI